MSLYKHQLQLVRQNLLKEIEEIDPKIAETIPSGFNNNIHWHIGHILTAAEQFLLGFPESGHLPRQYSELFGYGSKPANWTGDVPSIEELRNQLQEQLDRLLAIPEEKLQDKLPEPIFGLETVGEILNMTLFHEANHIGQIHAMVKVVTNN